jgi:hypothetical protein
MYWAWFDVYRTALLWVDFVLKIIGLAQIFLVLAEHIIVLAQ